MIKKYTFFILALLVLSSFKSFENKRDHQKTKLKKSFYLQNDELIKKGKSIFLKNQCNLCHNEKKEGYAPSLANINQHYKGDKKKLIKFLKRESKPIVLPNDYGIMAANLFKTKKMSDEELNALAAYLSSIK